MFNETVKVSGHIKMTVVRDGKIIETREIDNLIVTIGKAEIARCIGTGLAGTPFNYLAYGTGIIAAAAGDTALGTETARAVASSITNVTTDTTNDSVLFSKTFTIAGTVAVTESGILNAATAGDLLARQVFGALNLVVNDFYTIDWTIKLA